MSAGQDNSSKNSSLVLGYKTWLEKDDAILGEGFFQILEYIRQTGSIAGAASAMGMSYRTAWGKIKNAERKCSIPLVITRVGGETGGGAKLTPEAVRLLQSYYHFKEEVDREINKIFKRFFKV
ncbi:molybdenum-binding protein [Desulfoscipio gibsoniae DSM 7213]|uniref:Molybdenum-binding protein n=1 Tax=Desulfoscipio gibsoniae DSM 7213 TaxID=767817 RepID=R4KMF5_9FIRM|nr:LysR family transcriptional regulator [Desulfoscipio gibsoniae]AGL00816.1 molybdenum-binding protein [Desulfoscipio gibsoniae DSM 7213]